MQNAAMLHECGDIGGDTPLKTQIHHLHSTYWFCELPHSIGSSRLFINARSLRGLTGLLT